MTGVITAALAIEPTARSTRAIGPWLRDALAGLDPAAADALMSRMELAVHEVCMNVVDHADLPAGGRIELSLALGPRDLTVWVRDGGPGFDLAAVPDPAGHELQERGYGLKIVRALVDDLTYRHTAAGNELALRIDLEGSP
ncbi:ATP-binding protein [Nakamurella sp.]|uniref:ATP-binding protein n=1 Tax=Nakamurella sp. TaxID=1869182 RepID=UPI003B3AE0AA